MYWNVYRHSNINKARNPTCSDVLQLLPGIDEASKTSLCDKFDAIISKGNYGFASVLVMTLTTYNDTLPVP